MNNQTIFVPVPKYAEISSKVCAQEISNDAPVKPFVFDRKKYVATGAIHLGGQTLQVDAIRIVPLVRYRGALPALTNNQHWRAVEKGKRARCYDGIIVYVGTTRFVCTGDSITFKCSETGQQTELF